MGHPHCHDGTLPVQAVDNTDGTNLQINGDTATCPRLVHPRTLVRRRKPGAFRRILT